MAAPFYVTTPIYYINDVPHLGSAYTTIAADVLCRYHRLRGQECHFLTGTDEHGLKIQRVAAERGVAPQALADDVAATFKATWPQLGCAPDDFIRTSETRHKHGAQALWQQIEAAGDLYLGHYQGLYCVGCEAYYTEKELLPGGFCPLHKTKAEQVREESYFFRLSKYQNKLLEFYEKHPQFVQPTGRFNEVKRFVEGGLEDLSVSRTTFRWGVPVPGNDRHIMYVWFDALSNYMTALQAPVDRKRFWPASLHLVGKDILRFHAVYWPAFLMSAGYGDALPAQIFAHGFLTFGGQKMSKSLRNTIGPVELAKAVHPTLGVDVVRYCLMRSISFGHDGDFSMTDVVNRYTTDLGNALGNLLNRTLPFADVAPAYGPGTDLETELLLAYRQGAMGAAAAFDHHNPTRALEQVWSILAAANHYVDRAAPWVAKKESPPRLDVIVGHLLRILEGVSLMIAPVMPAVAASLRAQLGAPGLEGHVDRDQWPAEPPALHPGRKIPKGAPLFPRLDPEVAKQLIERFSPDPSAPTTPDDGATASTPIAPAAPASAGTPADGNVTFEDFSKLELRVGKVLSAMRVPAKDRLLQLSVDVGGPEPRTIISGIAEAYAPEALLQKLVLVLCNLPPRKFGKGLVSSGMLLAAGEGPTLSLLTPDRDAKPGDRVG